jgi:hypothetical protein
MCVEVDQADSVVSGNHLFGQATLKDPVSGDVAQYQGLTVLGTENNDGDGTLCLGGNASSFCPLGAEYDGCPTEWLLNHFADGVADPVASERGVDATVRTRLTVVRCGEDFFSLGEGDTAVEFVATNELGESLSLGNFAFDEPWTELMLSDIDALLAAPGFGSTVGQTRIRSIDGTGFLVIAEQIHTTADRTTSAAVELWENRAAPGGQDFIRMPFGFGGTQ